MQLKSDPHIFSGMQRDMSVSRHKAESLWDAHNIRFTARDGDTLLSITNEKGTSEVQLSSTLQGSYLGHCVINDYVILFTTTGTTDYIYKILGTAVTTLYSGHLKFSIDYPIETLGVYENDKIQKVYWIDGRNQPRYIFTGNYPATRVTSGNDTQFDFVATLDLKEEVSVTRQEGRGMFAPGTIQYVFTYYDKYGRQSNIFYTTLLNYISYPDRAGKQDERISNCFEVKITKLQTNFDYLRVYSIHRTSYNAVPNVKRVIDIDLNEISVETSGGYNFKTASFIDDGQIGDNIDPTELLYLGGENIIPKTITQKNNTLFFGNIEISRPSINSTYKEALCAVGKTEAQVNQVLKITEGLKSYQLKSFDTSNEYYKYANTLNGGLPGFKNREHYRIGVQFQYKSGKWSEPIFIGDYTLDGITTDEHNQTVSNNPSLHIDENNGEYTATLSVPKLTLKLLLQEGTAEDSPAIDEGYVKVRPVVVLPTLSDRLVLTQGILCPTVFSKANRKHSSPFAQSSWFLRPSIPRNVEGVISGCVADVSELQVPGVYVPYRHLESLGQEQGELTNGRKVFRSIEIQGSNETLEQHVDNDSVTFDRLDPPEDKQFFVDQSVVTMHSPDIEWDEQFDFLNYTDWRLRVVGATLFTSTCSDIDIQTSSPANLDGKGFTKLRYNTNNSYYAGGHFVSSLAWNDCVVASEANDDGSLKYYMWGAKGGGNSKEATKYDYLVYPWQRSGALNNDENRGDGSATTALLKQKKMSNLKFSLYNKFFDYSGLTSGDFDGTLDISQIQLFNSDQVTLTKIPLKNKSFNDYDLNYYGNVDTLLSGNLCNISIARGTNTNDYTNLVNSYGDIFYDFIHNEPLAVLETSKLNNILYTVTTPVRMKYKSSRHLVFSLNNNSDQSANILPRVGTVPSDASSNRSDYANKMFWVDTTTINDALSTKEVIIDGIYDNLDKAGELLNYYSLVVNDIIILLTGGATNSNDITVPVLCKVTAVNTDSITATALATTPGKFYRGDYYVSAKNEGGDVLYFRPSTADNPITGQVELCTYADVVASLDLQDDVNPYTVHQSVIPNSGNTGVNTVKNAHLLLGELYREAIPWEGTNDTDYPYFSGNTDDATKSNLWIPAGEPVRLDAAYTELDNGVTKKYINVEFTEGDTWYSRYDCLKTYPFTMEDENSIIEIASFLCESRVNPDGRCDRNRGQMSNINMSPINFNLLNPVYNNHDNFFNYRVLDEDYYTLNKFSNQITWSKEKQMASDVDAWTNITLANTFDLDGVMGPINGLTTWSDTIYCFQNKAISVISFNPRVQIPVTDGVPIEISNSGKLEGKIYITTDIGCDNKKTICVTPSGIYFVDPNSKELYNVAGKELKGISTSHGFSDWFKKTTMDRSFYDSNRNDLYVMNNDDCITYSEIVGQFTSFMDYNGTPAMFNIKDKFYAFRNETGTVNMYQLFAGDYNTFFKETGKPFWIEFVSNADAALDKIFSTVDMRLDFHSSGVADNTTFFNQIRVYNEYQDTGSGDDIQTIYWHTLKPSAIKRKFRIWRVNIPRDKDKRLDRIRNTWAKIFFKQSNPGNKKMILHDLSVQYFI